MSDVMRTANYGQEDTSASITVYFERLTTAELTTLSSARRIVIGKLYYDTTVARFKIGIDHGTVSSNLLIEGTAINGTPIGTTTPAAATFAQVSFNTTMFTGSSGRAVNSTAALASISLGVGVQVTYIQSPAAAITITLPAVGTDGFRCQVSFGAATTVTWAGGTVAPGTKTSFAAGDTYELIYNAVAGTPANSAATTWYPM